MFDVLNIFRKSSTTSNFYSREKFKVSTDKEPNYAKGAEQSSLGLEIRLAGVRPQSLRDPQGPKTQNIVTALFGFTA